MKDRAARLVAQCARHDEFVGRLLLHQRAAAHTCAAERDRDVRGIRHAHDRLQRDAEARLEAFGRFEDVDVLAGGESYDLAAAIDALRLCDLHGRSVAIDDLPGSCGGALQSQLCGGALPLQIRRGRNQARRDCYGETQNERQLRHAEAGIHTDESVRRLSLTVSAASGVSRCDPAPVSRNAPGSRADLSHRRGLAGPVRTT